MSVSSHGRQGNDGSFGPEISAHGGSVAFSSYSSNLVHKDHNGQADVFVRTTAGVTRRVSVSSGGAAGNHNSARPAISAHGRYVAFESEASNLVPTDTNADADVFVRDLAPGRTGRVSVSSEESQADGWSLYPAISANGRYVAFESLASNLVVPETNNGDFVRVFLRDRRTGVTTQVSQTRSGEPADGSSGSAAISGDGHRVTFSSGAPDLVAGDSNGRTDVFIRRTSR